MDPELPRHLHPFVLPVSEVARRRRVRYDVYAPAGYARLPAIVFLHGLYPAGLPQRARDWPTYVGYGSVATAYHTLGIVLDVRLHEPGDYPAAAEAVASTIEAVRREPGVDPDRVAVWCFSAGGLLASEWLSDPPAWLRCLAVTYPVLAPLPGWQVDARFRPIEALSRSAPPIVFSRAGRERPDIAAAVPPFLARAAELGIGVDMIEVPDGQHGFDSLDHTDASRTAVQTAFRMVAGYLAE